MNKQKFITSICLLMSIFYINAQEEDKKKDYGTISTDRPDQTEASNLVPKKFLQVETGAFFESLNNVDATTYNTTLLRYGLLGNLELRVGFDNTETKINSNTIGSGFSPLLLGVKIGISEEKGLLPEIAFIGHINPDFLASSDYKTLNTAVDFRFSLSHTLSERSSIGYNLGMAWDGDTPEPSYVYTLAYGYSITDKVGAYIELYGDLPENSSAMHKWDAGVTYLISDNIQLDVSGGTGITKNVQDLFLSAGISFRIPE